MKTVEIESLVERWINGNLEAVSSELIEVMREGYLEVIINFITLLLKERYLVDCAQQVEGTSILANPPLTYNGWLDLARLSEMLK